MDYMELLKPFLANSGIINYFIDRASIKPDEAAAGLAADLGFDSAIDGVDDAEARGFSSSGGAVAYTKGIKFPSIEVALLALAFLTFATQFIVNVQQLVAAIQNGRRRKRDVQQDNLEWLDHQPGQKNATDEILRLTGLIHDAEDDFELLLDKLSSCKSSFSSSSPFD